MHTTPFLQVIHSPLGSFEKKIKKKSSPLKIISCQLVFNDSIDTSFVANGSLNSNSSESLKHSFQCSSKHFSGHFIVLTFQELPSYDISLVITSIASLIHAKLSIHQFLGYRYPISNSELYDYKVFFSFSEKFNLDNPQLFLFKGFTPNVNIFSTESHAITFSLKNPSDNSFIDPSSIETLSTSFCSNIKTEDLQSLITKQSI
jgi:hypothetical protein